VIDDVDFVALDTETTGLGPVAARVVEIGAVRFRGGREVARFETLVDPRVPIPPEASAIHGLRDADVAGAPDFDPAARRFLEFARGAVLVAHNAAFDASILAPEFARSGIEPSLEPLLCSCRLARKAFRGAFRSFSLGALVRELGIGRSAAHRALADALAAKEVFLRALERPEPPATLADLLRRHGPVFRLSGRARPGARLPSPLAAIGRAAEEGAPVEFAYELPDGRVVPIRARARRLFTVGRVSYLDTDDGAGRGAARTFRVDRILLPG